MIEKLFVERLTMVAIYSSVLLSFLLFLCADRNPGRMRSWMVGITAWLGSYLIIVCAVNVVDSYISWRFDTFDLDRDSVFSDREMEGDFVYWSDKHIMDTARTFIPFTGFIHAAIVLGMAYVLTLLRRGIGLLIRLVRQSLVDEP